MWLCSRRSSAPLAAFVLLVVVHHLPDRDPDRRNGVAMTFTTDTTTTAVHIAEEKKHVIRSWSLRATEPNISSASVTKQALPSKPLPVCEPILDGSRMFQLARFHTTKGTFDVQIRPDLAPAGADHLVRMIKAGYWENIAFFRVNQWITQFGVDERSARPQFNELRVFTDTDKDLNPCGTLRWAKGTFAVLGGNQHLIVINPNDQMGKNKKDAPCGYIVDGMNVIQSLYKYNDPIDHPNAGPGPDQTKIGADGGTEYLKKNFPKLDYILKVELIEP